MKLVEPGPQPPPFEVEYSELESDKLQAEGQSEEHTAQVESSVEAVAESQTEPNSAEANVSVESQAVEQSTDANSSESQATNDDSAGEDSFGAGLEVGDATSKSEVEKTPDSGEESNSQGIGATKAEGETEPDGKKRGKRPNRRRRSRRSQKKKDGPSPKSES